MVIILVKSKPVLKCAAYLMALCLGQPAAGSQAVQPALAPPLPDINQNTDGRVLFFDENYTDNLEETLVDTEPEEELQEESQEEKEEVIMFPRVRLNFREGPGLEAEVIKVLRPNEEVVILENADGWYHVCLKPAEGDEDGEEPIFGYVKEEYLSAEKLAISELNRWGIDLTPEEIDLLAKILWVEARGEPYDGQVAVVEVIFNRMISNDSDFPEEDLRGIVSSTRNGVQFASWKLRDTADPGPELYRVIYQVLEGSVEVLPSTRYVYFSTRGIGRNIIRIGSHRFGT